MPWTQSYQYDGFGNLTARVLNGATTPIAVNAATNRLSNAYYDANGNMTSGAGAGLTYDEANRLSSATEVSGGMQSYQYTADNKRFYVNSNDGQGNVTEQLTFYGARGERLGVYSIGAIQRIQQPWCCGFYTYTVPITPVATNVWFAGRLILESSSPVYQDRVGTNRTGGARFYPYGDEITSTANDHIKFGTYTRDGYTGLDYADQRYYASTYGRFNTPDPSWTSVSANSPGTWNRYSYGRLDPVNRNDPQGLDDDDDDGGVFVGDGSGLIDLNPAPCIGYGNGCNCYQALVLDPGCISTFGLATAELWLAPTSPPAPTCSISLEERPVGGIGGAIGGEHTYLYVQGPAGIVPPQGSETIEGGPDFGFIGYLVSTVSSPPGNGLPGTLPGGPYNVKVGSAFTGSVACGDIQTITSKLSHYGPALGNAAVYNAFPPLGLGYNSNSFTYTLLYDVGLSTFFGSPSIRAVGWGYLVPGLQ